MTQRGQFFDSSGGDRVYTSDAWAQVIQRIAGDGVVIDVAAGLLVEQSSPPAMTVKVNLGVAFVQGRFFEVYSSFETLAVTAAHATLPRIDRVVVRLSYTARTITLAVKAGTAAASPVAPTMQRDTSIWEISLARIAVAANQTSVVTANITSERADSAVCGISDLVLETAHQRSTTNPHSTTAAQVGALTDVAFGGAAASNAQFSKSLVGTILTLAMNIATGALAGLMSASDKTKLDAASTVGGGNLVMRDANGDTTLRRLTLSGASIQSLFVGNGASLGDFGVANAMRLMGTANNALGDLYSGTPNNRFWHDGWIDSAKLQTILGAGSLIKKQTINFTGNGTANSATLGHSLGVEPMVAQVWGGTKGVGYSTLVAGAVFTVNTTTVQVSIPGSTFGNGFGYHIELLA